MQKIILSGIQPSGDLNIGHYLGAMRNWLRLQGNNQCLFMIADLHAITVRQDPKLLRQRVQTMAALYLACGIDPSQSTIFVQSAVPEHAQLAWALNCHTGLGELQRMTQFKDKSQRQESVQAGLLNYPTLMAADILLYQSDLVPVGEDQKQHLELARDLAQRMNHIYASELFRVPEPMIPSFAARIMSLQQPERKMSKSDQNPLASLNLLDSDKLIEKKCKSAVTDSETEIRYDPVAKPGVSNLLTILGAVSDRSIADIESEYRDQMYGHLKIGTAKAVNGLLGPIRDSYNHWISHPVALQELLDEHAQRARHIARKTLASVYAALGLSFPA